MAAAVAWFGKLTDEERRQQAADFASHADALLLEAWTVWNEAPNDLAAVRMGIVLMDQASTYWRQVHRALRDHGSFVQPDPEASRAAGEWPEPTDNKGT